LNFYESFFNKKPEFSTSFSQENNDLGKLDMSINRNIENHRLYSTNDMNNYSFNKEIKKKNIKYKKIIPNMDIFSQLTDCGHKENVYIRKKLKIRFSLE